MFCKKCGNRLTAGDTVCPHCGCEVTRDALSSRFVVQLPKGENDAAAPVRAQIVPQTPPVKKAVPPVSEEAPKEPAAAAPTASPTIPVPPVPPVTPIPSVAEEEPVPDNPTVSAMPDSALPDPMPQFEEDRSAAPAPETTPVMPKITPIPYRESPREKRSRVMLKVTALVCTALMLTFAAIGKWTTLFSKEQNAQKTVALSGFTADEERSFLDFFAPFSALYGQNITFRTLDAGQLLQLLHPEDSAGLFASVSRTAPSPLTEPADPLERFADGYYAIRIDQIESIAKQLSVPFVANADTADSYFYGDTGYFRALAPARSSTRTPVSAEARRTEDGSYYVICTCDDSSKVYCMATVDNGVWALETLSADPLFSADGTQIATDNNALNYKMRQTVIEAKTASGQLYARYVVNYPYFTDADSAVAQTINALYAETVKSYQTKAAEADAAYSHYLKKGYDTALLPAYTYVVTTVSCNQNSWISLLDEITTYTPETFAKEKQKAAEAGEEWDALLMPTRAYSGYTANLETGEILRKEDLFGSNYETIQDSLSRAYLGDAASELSQEELATLGQQIYSAAWVLTDDGVAFCHQGSAGYTQQVVLPYTDIPNADNVLHFQQAEEQ